MRLPRTAAHLAVRLQASIGSFVRASHQNLGHLEAQVSQQAQELLRQASQTAAQQKADATPPRCQVCGQPRTFETRFGALTVARTRGYCKRCGRWRCPADTALGLAESAGYSPAVQEMAALLAAKMPVAEASLVLERLTGIKLPRTTLYREARRQGERAQALRRAAAQTHSIGTEPAPLPNDPATRRVEPPRARRLGRNGRVATQR